MPSTLLIGKLFALLAVFSGLLTASGNVRAGDAELTIDPAKPGPAISPYVYGQFIEHLGRCIRDGIWAEKLRDRKFLLEPAKSAWQTVKPDGAACDVFHDPAGAYCGQHCMAVWVRDAKGGKCGISQNGIGLLEGKEYVGYAILARAPTGEDARATTPVEVRLAWGPGPDDGQSVTLNEVSAAYKKLPLRFKAGATTDNATLSVTLSSPAYLWVACLSLMPADNVKGMRADTLELLRTLNSPIYRWPGGNFVSGYNWKDAIGDRDRRPPRWERAWNDVEDNDFGLDEFMTLCREIATEPMIVVNTGLGSVQDAADEVAYANGAAETRWGSERARNGHAAPYGVVWWGIGNEMYGGWQLGNVPVEHYAVRHNAFVQAMRAVDPKIKVIAVGAPGKWNDLVLGGCAANTDLLSMHHYSERKFRVPLSPEDAAKYEAGFPNYSACVLNGVRGLIADMRKRLGKDPKIDAIKLCIDEWGIVREWNPAPDATGVGAFEHYYTIGDAVAVGRALHELLRSTDLVGIAMWPQTVNVIGAIKTTRNHACMDAVGHVLTLYRARVNGRLVPLSLPAGTTVDAVAALDEKAEVLTIGLINFSPNQEATLALHVSGVGNAAPATAWRINGATLGAHNIPGQPEAVTTRKLAEPVPLDRPVVLPAHSLTVLEAKLK
ncbi:MAG: hypothetical protein NTW87_18300 [Planctomycetota bacterium]|nr:hypothetical protein [Planctomycetota bacterium]